MPDEFELEPGTYRVYRVDGSEELIREKPTIEAIEKAIGADAIDTVLLDRRREIVMVVDDTGMIDGKPVNRAASALARKAFKTYLHDIHGDVAVVFDGDFK